MEEKIVGSTHPFVLSKGIVKVGNYDALIGDDDTKRLFAELYADPDRPDARPREAYQALLSSMQPGWTLRLLQLFWPDAEPRLAFQRQVLGWAVPDGEGLAILSEGLLLAVQEQALPYTRRTILEFVLPGDEGLAWWEGVRGIGRSFGIRLVYLRADEISFLQRKLFNLSFT
jgi:hypothetical protein